MNTALTTNGTMTINIPFTQPYSWFMTLYLAELNPNASNSSREFYVGVPGYSPTLLVNPVVNGSGLGGYVDIDYHGEVPNYISLFKNQSISTALGPLVNALEIFELSQNQSAILTNEQDSKLPTQPWKNSSFMFQLPQHSNNELAFIAYLSCCLQPSI
jgi:hypothetical protein